MVGLAEHVTNMSLSTFYFGHVTYKRDHRTPKGQITIVNTQLSKDYTAYFFDFTALVLQNYFEELLRANVRENRAEFKFCGHSSKPTPP